jgi:aspartyl-tRNA(Asn)/glutamyl-tRNA(Gln) amidotransferase subunit C
MSIGRDEVLHVARLAEIAVADAELPKLVEQMNRIVDYVAQLDELAADGGPEAVVAGPARVTLRDDIARRYPLARTPADMAPEFIGGFFTVPRHIGGEEG